MVRTTVDLTDDDTFFPEGRVPEPAFISDEMDWVLCFSDLEIRMTYAQWDKIIEAYRKWVNTDAPGNPCDFEEWDKTS